MATIRTLLLMFPSAAGAAIKPVSQGADGGTSRATGLWGGMGDDKTYTDPSKVSAEDGDVVVDGPDGVDVKLSPEAAVETSERLLATAAEAQGQRVRKGYRPPSPDKRG